MSLRYGDYIPSNNVVFCDWVERAFDYAAINHERWGVEAPNENITGKHARLKTLSHICTTSKRTPESMVERNMLRKEVEREVRNYLQGFVMRNPHVTELDRVAMGLPIRDAKPSPIGDPVGLVQATVKYPHEGAIELLIAHVDATPFDKRANSGVKISYDVFALDAVIPDTPEALHRSLFTRRKKALIIFDSSDRGKKAVFCLRYENNKGKTGQWGNITSAVIP